jgi:hypothetical protein
MPAKVPPFELHFEIIFLENYAQLKPGEQKAIDKAIGFLKNNPRHPSLNPPYPRKEAFCGGKIIFREIQITHRAG